MQNHPAIPINYKGFSARDPLYIDILVEGSVIAEVKATKKIHSIHEVQLLTYLHLIDHRLGLLTILAKNLSKMLLGFL